MADLLAFVDVQAKTQTQVQKQKASGSNNNSDREPKIFDSLMNEYRDTKNLKKENPAPENSQPELNHENLTAFKGSKLFSSSVIEILADAPENLEIMPQELLNVDSEINNLVEELKISLGEVKNSQPEVFYNDDEIIFNEEISQLLNLSDEELKAKLEALPEDLRLEIKSLIDEINNALKNGGNMNEIKSLVENLSGIINKNENNSKPEIKKISDEELNDDDDNNKKIKNDNGQAPELISNEAAGTVAAAANDGNKTVDNNAGEKPEKNFDVKDFSTRQNPKVTVKNQNVSNEINSDNQAQNNEAPKTEAKFSEQLNNLEENSSENQSQNQNPDFNQARGNFSENHNQSRSRNENRRVSNENLNDNEENFNTRQVNSRNDFQNFFEGVLNSRRTSSTASSQPLNLRGDFNLNQSETLRDGLVNVVRFIRSDGVQKASVVIDPPALGRISVELTSSSSGVEASIKVASEQIRQLVQDQLTQLRMNLSEQGVQVAEFTVDVQQDNQQGGGSQNQNQQGGRENFIPEADVDDETEEFRIDLEEGLLYWVA